MPARRSIRTRPEEAAAPYERRGTNRGDDDSNEVAGQGDEPEPFRHDFYNSVYRTVKTIPEGRVASYGTIGKLIGHPRHSRMVGAALKCLPPSMSSPYLLNAPPPPRSNSGESTASSTSTSSTSTTRNPLFLPLNDGNNEEDGSDLFDFLNPIPTSTSTTDTVTTTTNDEGEEYIEPLPVPNPDWVPWHRVVSSTGVISPRGNDRAVRRQADYLIAEGVEVKDGPRTGSDPAGSNRDSFGLAGVSGGRVSMTVYGWKG